MRKGCPPVVRLRTSTKPTTGYCSFVEFDGAPSAQAAVRTLRCCNDFVEDATVVAQFVRDEEGV